MNTSDFVAGENVTDEVQCNIDGSIYVTVKLTPEEADKIIDIAEDCNKTVAQVAHRGINQFVTDMHEFMDLGKK
jgi:hypothetical protein